MTLVMVGYKQDANAVASPSNPQPAMEMSHAESATTIFKLNPEFWRRIKRMIIDSAVVSMWVRVDGVVSQELVYSVGVGTGWRSSIVQATVFAQRHVEDPHGAILCGGKRYSLKPGMASAACPGSSYHEDFPQGGGTMAVDLVGNIQWAASVEAKYGVHNFQKVNNELWHQQPVEIPNARSKYDVHDADYNPLPIWNFDPTPEPGPTPEPEPTPTTEDDDMPLNLYIRPPAGANPPQPEFALIVDGAGGTGIAFDNQPDAAQFLQKVKPIELNCASITEYQAYRKVALQGDAV